MLVKYLLVSSTSFSWTNFASLFVVRKERRTSSLLFFMLSLGIAMLTNQMNADNEQLGLREIVIKIKNLSKNTVEVAVELST